MSESTEDLPWEAAFVANMRRARMALDVSQTELARRVTIRGVRGFHQQTVQRIESGSRPVRLNEAVVIADSLAMNLYDMLGPSTTLDAARNLEAFVGTALARWRGYQGDAAQLWDAAEEDIESLGALLAVYEASAASEGVTTDEAWLSRIGELREQLSEAAIHASELSKTWSKLSHPSRHIGLPDGVDPEA